MVGFEFDELLLFIGFCGWLVHVFEESELLSLLFGELTLSVGVVGTVESKI